MTMEDQVQRLVQKINAQRRTLPTSRRLLIAISGIPGSGKTSLAFELVKQLNQSRDTGNAGHAHGRSAVLISMDGFHLSRAQLSAMPDPEKAYARRGAAFTFDVSAFLRLVKALREPLSAKTQTLLAPSFDHAVKDPVPNDLAITPVAEVVIFEGNYLSLDQGDWLLAAKLMDELWFVEVDIAVARNRLISRHIRAGIAQNQAEAARRADENDLVNGAEIIEKRLNVQELIPSLEDVAWEGRT